MSKFGSEAEMLMMLTPWLEDRGWEVFKEVECPGGFTDIVAKKGDYLWGIEGKVSCNDIVITQAERSLNTYHINSIAVPRLPNKIYDYYMRHKGIGCLVIQRNDEYARAETGYEANVYIDIVPEMNENPKKLNKIVLHDSMKNQVAGTTGEKRITIYKITVINVQEFIVSSGPSSLQELLDNVEMHWEKRRCRRNLKNMLTNWEHHKFEMIWDDDRQEHLFAVKPEFI